MNSIRQIQRPKWKEKQSHWRGLTFSQMSFQKTPYSSSYPHHLVRVDSEKSDGNFRNKCLFYYLVKNPIVSFQIIILYFYWTWKSEMKQNIILCCDTNLSKPRLINCHHTSALRLMNLCSPQCTLGIIMLNGPGVSIAHLFESQWLS